MSFLRVIFLDYKRLYDIIIYDSVLIDEEVTMDENNHCVELINEAVGMWTHIGNDETGAEYRLPLSRKEMKWAKNRLKVIREQGCGEAGYQKQIDYIRNILKQGGRRRMRVNWKVIIMTLIFIGIWAFSSRVHKPVAETIRGLEGQKLAEYRAEVLSREREDVSYYTEKIPVAEAEIKSAEEKYGKEMPKDVKKKYKHNKKWLKKYREYLAESKEFLKNTSGLNLQEFKAYYIEDAMRGRMEQVWGMIIWGIAIILYMITGLRPTFLFWRRGYKQGSFFDPDAAAGNIVSASVFSSLANFDRNSWEYIHWSDGSITKHADLTGGFIGIIISVTILLFYMMFCVVTLPLRIVVNFFRNYVFYI